MRGLRAGLSAGLIGALTWSGAAFGGAWTLPSGGAQVIVTSTASLADRTFGAGLATQISPRYRKLELQALVEYGVTDWFTAIAMPSLQNIDIAAPMNARRGGLGYSDFGGRVRALEGNGWVFSGQATVRVPGAGDIANPAAIGYTDVEVDIRALFGANFVIADWPAFIDVQAAHRMRTGAPPDEFRADVTLGIRPWARWLFMAQSFSVISEGSGAAPFARYAYNKLQLSAVYALTPALSLQAGGFVTYAGRNALQENGLILGAWYRF